MTGFSEVSFDRFYGIIRDRRLNVHPRCEIFRENGRALCRSVFESPSRRVFGYAVDYLPEGSGLTAKRYYIRSEEV